jgi:hypothetical protein
MTRAVLTAATALATLPASAGASGMSVSTGDVSGRSATGATLRADVDHATQGGDVTWQYGTTTAYGSTTLSVALTAQDSSQRRTLPLTCLKPAITYHVRAVAMSGLTTVYGSDRKFTTLPAIAAVVGAQCTQPGDGSGSSAGSGTSSTDPGTAATPAADSGSSSSGQATSGTPTGSSTTGTTGGGATVAPGVATADVTPVLGRTLAIATVAGKVTATSPSGARLDLGDARAVPTGTLIDTRRGTVELKTALDRKGTTQTGRFWGGLFQVRQGTTARGLTRLVLRGGDFSGCPARAARTVARASTVTKKNSPPRSLWGSDHHGRFQTRGRGSVATVRGTRWLTEDRCNGTRTTVAAGAVAVRDLHRHRTVVVTKGHSYLARLAP